MTRWKFCTALILALLSAESTKLFAQGLTIQMANCPKIVRAGQNLDSSFKVVVVNNGKTAVKNVALEFVLKSDANCSVPARHAFYSPSWFDGVLLREGRESVSLQPAQKATISPHGANTIPIDTPVGRTYFLCAVIVAGEGEKNIVDGSNCACCPIKVVGVEERPVITGFGGTCVSRRGTITIFGRNFGTSEGKTVFLAGGGASVGLTTVSWSDSVIMAQVPDDPNIRDGQRYSAGIRKTETGELLGSGSLSISVCPERKTAPGPGGVTPPPAPPFFYQ